MKSYTDIEQSKKLAEVLPIESADMFYSAGNETQPIFRLHSYGHIMSDKDFPCWSLAALLDILPKKYYPIKDHETDLILGKPKDKWCALYWDTTGMKDGEQTLAGNPVDACYKMILKLHELKKDDEDIMENNKKNNYCCEVNDEALEQQLQIWFDKGKCSGRDEVIFHPEKFGLQKQGEQNPNPYSGTSFEYNGHTWGMCARDNGVEILVDGKIKDRVFLNDDISKELFIKALERVEEQNNKGYTLTDCDKNSWWEDFKAYSYIKQKSYINDELFDHKYTQNFVEKQNQTYMIQWKGNNLKEVIEFTGKDKNFDKWFKSFEEYEKYVYDHNNIFKMFTEDGSHYEVPVGAWIIKTPDGCNVAPKAIFVQNSSWNEEDEFILKDAITAVDLMLTPEFQESNPNLYKSFEVAKRWLKYIKERVQPQNTITDKELAQAKKDAYNDALDKIEYHSGEPTFDDGWSAAIWYLKKKNVQPQNTWKPSEEQMDALYTYIYNPQYFSSQDPRIELVESVYQDLKKLREE